MVQSAVSLFVELPLSYQAKIAEVQGVENICKWQWFGGYYQEPGNFFAQFAVDPETLFAMYPEIEIVAESQEPFLRRAPRASSATRSPSSSAGRSATRSR